ncbi:TPA: phage tail protein [Yersinia enterocolitica]|nr:phage tail protein [Yersinia enterocolitica]
MSIFLTQAFEQWMAQCAIDNLPARPDTIVFARMGREPSRDDPHPPQENITHTATNLRYGRLNSHAIVCSAVIDEDVPDFTYDWICLIHQASRTLCGVIKTPERHKVAGETLIRNFVLIYNGIAQAAHITTPPESWQLDINAWLRAGAARATQTLKDFYGHHVFINDCARIFMRDSQACCTQGVVYIAGMRIEIQEATLPALKENDYLYIRAWLDGHTPHGIPITGYQLEHGPAVPDDDSINHFAPIARLTRTTDWEDLRVRTRSFQDALDGITAQLEQATSLVEKATESANSATQAAQETQKSQEAAQLAAERAEQATQATLKTANNLSEIADAGTAAQQHARQHLGLGDAATMNVQSDIYDRTEGRLALPGAFGYGAYFRQSKTFSGNNGPAEFLAWVRETPPGRYYVSQYAGNQQIIPGVVFSGMIEIIIPNTVAHNEDQRQKGKLILFSGVNGDLYLNQLYTNSISGDGFIGWENLKLKISDFTNALHSTTGNSWGSPGVGGLIFAAYCGESDDDNNRTLIRGKVIPGSRLGMLTLSGSYSTTGTYQSTPRLSVVTPNNYPQAGTFVALSGNTMNTGDKTTALIGLFIRVA